MELPGRSTCREIGGGPSRPQKRAPELRRADNTEQYAESDDVAQAFVFHKAPPD